MTEILLADLQARTVKGMLLPWNEASRPSNIGIIEFARGVLRIPRDPSVVTANIRHKREQPVGRATLLEDTDEGLVATFAIADTEEGDQLLLDISEGRMKRLSAEVKEIVRQGTKALSGALFGAAFVPEGAFDSAALYAELAEPVTTTEHTEDEFTDENGVKWRRVADIERTTETTESGTKTTTTTTAVEETESPTEGDEEEEETVPVPNTLEAAAAPRRRTTLRDVSEALAAKHFSGNSTLLASILAEEEYHSDDMLFAALNDIKSTYTGSVGVNIIQPQWINELWAGRRYQRKYIPLINNDTLTSYKVEGYEWVTKPEMAEWTGDKTNIHSNTPETAPYSATAKRYAGGHDIAREFRDWDVAPFWESYFAAMTDSYAKLTDDAALAALVAGATVVSAGSVPTDASKGVAALIDGALAVVEVGTPSFAIVGSGIYRDLLLTGKDHVAEFLSMSLGLEDGNLSGFRIIPSSAASLVGKVLVGAKSAATFRELPGSPIRTEALDQIKGGIDEALFGYALTYVENADGLAIVTAAS